MSLLTLPLIRPSMHGVQSLGTNLFGIFLPANDHRPIHLKEAEGLLKTLEAQSVKIYKTIEVM